MTSIRRIISCLKRCSRRDLCITAFLIFVFVTVGVPRRNALPANAVETNSAENVTRYLTITKDAAERTGNMLFKYATLIGLSRRFGMTPVLRRGDPVLEFLEVGDAVHVLSDADWCATKWIIVRESKACAYSIKASETVLMTAQYVRLIGYFQSWKYFYEEESHVFSNLRFLNSHTKAAAAEFKRLQKSNQLREILKQSPSEVSLNSDRRNRSDFKYVFQRGLRAALGLKRSNLVFIGVHIRRGDLLFDSTLVNYGYRLPSASYYQNAISLLRDRLQVELDRLVFIVGSDELAYARRVSAYWNAETFHLESQSPVADLLLLAACDHTIMSVGSFGWWSSYLKRSRKGDPITTYYIKPFARHSALENQFDSTLVDFYPPEWIPIDN